MCLLLPFPVLPHQQGLGCRQLGVVEGTPALLLILGESVGHLTEKRGVTCRFSARVLYPIKEALSLVHPLFSCPLVLSSLVLVYLDVVFFMCLVLGIHRAP